MSTPGILNELIDRFRNNIDAYKSAKYNEAQLRGEFVNPLFEALGWDVYNKKGYAEAYKDVIQEDAIKVGGATKAPDYSFRIGGVRKFFLETKKPSVNIKDDPEPAFQLRRYAWSAKLPLSILTDFEEFAVYDCRIKPAPNDKPSTGRIMYFNYKEYPEKWDDIASVFSRDAILKGSFDRFVESEKKKRGTAEVDDAFLKEIEAWRDAIARNIALRNEGLTERDVNFAVQLTIDRIIFLRICEDRGIEEYGRLQALLNGEHVYRRMVALYYRADEKYNSGLFHFQSERGRPGQPDELTPDLKIDDKVLKDIIKGLYYPESPYEFSVLPVDILGHVYERFLGKVIRLTAGGRAKVEEKPEVRKAGGVYYTPKYIVDYIVENTVGRLLWGKDENRKSERGNKKQKLTPKQAAKLRILDPACGSGSFLIGAYEYLLDWHRDWYVENDPLKYKKQIYQGAGEQWYLTTAEKKRILLNNIYGVDIDTQAVEVTKLNLLLKALEGESEETIESQLKMFRERALPDLRGNIKCGNSLIGPDFYDDTQLDLLDDEERYRINAFDWEEEFPEIFKEDRRARRSSTEESAGGFDCVIGNPPYGAELFDIDYIKNKLPIASQMKEINSFLYFIEMGMGLLNKSGLFGYIIPDTLMYKIQYYNFRKYLHSMVSLYEIVETGSVFEKAKATPNIMIFISKNKPKSDNIISRKIVDHRNPLNRILSDIHSNNFYEVGELKYDDWGKSFLLSFGKYIDSKHVRIISKIVDSSVTLNSIEDVEINRGLEGGKSSLKNKGKYNILIPDHIDRYSIQSSKLFVNQWKESFSKDRILVIRIRSLKIRRRIIAALELEKRATLKTLQQIYFNENNKLSELKFILAILNSNAMNFYCNHFLIDDLNKEYLGQLPIPQVDDSNKRDKIVILVDKILDLHKQLAAAKPAHEKTTIQRQIDATDRQIDELVYELYGLGEEEVRVVEG